jgi:hypothetical protein
MSEDVAIIKRRIKDIKTKLQDAFIDGVAIDEVVELWGKMFHDEPHSVSEGFRPFTTTSPAQAIAHRFQLAHLYQVIGGNTSF